MTDHTGAANWVPTLTTADLHYKRELGDKISRAHVQLLAIHPTGHRIRFTVPMTSDYTKHLSFTVQVFSPETLSWKQLWTIPGTAFEFASTVDAVAEDPENNLIARAWSHNDHGHQARSWQKIINALAAKADEILPAHS
ncbi:hypothetical protein ACW9HH_35995 [Nocardia gipuzkoensis]